MSAVRSTRSADRPIRLAGVAEVQAGSAERTDALYEQLDEAIAEEMAS